MNSAPLISIIVPVYNVEKYLTKCLDSIIQQSYINLEVIIVDDGSPDRCGEICDEYAQKDRRIEVIHKKNGGVSQARIDAFNSSHGDFVFFVDADDYIAENCISVLYEKQVEKNADVVVCGIREVYKQKEKIQTITIKGFFNREKIEEGLRCSFLYESSTGKAGVRPYLCGKLYRREILADALKQGTGIWFEEDIVITTYILYHSNSLYIIEESLYYYVMHEGQVSKRNPLEISQQMAKARERISFFDKRKLLSTPLLYRHYASTNEILKKIVATKMPFSIYCHYFIEQRESLEQASFFSQYTPCRFSDWLLFFLLKYRRISIMYFIQLVYSYLK